MKSFHTVWNIIWVLNMKEMRDMEMKMNKVKIVTLKEKVIRKKEKKIQNLNPNLNLKEKIIKRMLKQKKNQSVNNNDSK